MCLSITGDLCDMFNVCVSITGQVCVFVQCVSVLRGRFARFLSVCLHLRADLCSR